MFNRSHFDGKERVYLKNRRCFVCLGGCHFASDCKSYASCTVDQCGGRHHCLLNSVHQEPVVAKTNASVNSGEVRLGFVPVVLMGPEGETVTNALLDTGSNVTLITKELAKTLKLEGDRCVLNVKLMNGSKPTTGRKVTFGLSPLDKECYVSATTPTP